MSKLGCIGRIEDDSMDQDGYVLSSTGPEPVELPEIPEFYALVHIQWANDLCQTTAFGPFLSDKEAQAYGTAMQVSSTMGGAERHFHAVVEGRHLSAGTGVWSGSVPLRRPL